MDIVSLLRMLMEDAATTQSPAESPDHASGYVTPDGAPIGENLVNTVTKIVSSAQTSFLFAIKALRDDAAKLRDDVANLSRLQQNTINSENMWRGRHQFQLEKAFDALSHIESTGAQSLAAIEEVAARVGKVESRVGQVESRQSITEQLLGESVADRNDLRARLQRIESWQQRVEARMGARSAEEAESLIQRFLALEALLTGGSDANG